jgi:tRNA(Leu) C34 or U34 (ribose-2'-O)-methylase TrmL
MAFLLGLMSSRPEKYAETIGRKKFIRLSSVRQHEYLALLARSALESGDFKGFLKRYDEMQSWVELDKYSPPEYLTEEEAIHEYLMFHKGFSTNPGILIKERDATAQTGNLSWEYRFDVTIVLDQVRSPYNTGSVLRLIDNFGFRRLVHNAEWLRLDHPQLCRAARGAQNWVPVEHKPDLMEWIDSLTIPVIGIENSDDAIPICEWQPETPCVVIIGNEVYGIAKSLREQCKTLVKIPMFGFKQSMNLHHALAIAGYKITSKA